MGLFGRMCMRHTCFNDEKTAVAPRLDQCCGHMDVPRIHMVCWSFGPFGRWPCCGGYSSRNDYSRSGISVLPLLSVVGGTTR